MRGIFLWVVLLASVNVFAERVRSPDSRERFPPSSVLQLLPNNTGFGMGTIHTDLAALFPDEFVGNWFQMHSTKAGAQFKGPLTLSPVGSPMTQTDVVLPCGADGCEVAGQRTSSSNRYATGPTTAATVDFTACWYGLADSRAPTQYLMAKWQTNGDHAWALILPPGVSAALFAMRNAEGTTTNVQAGSVEAGQRAFLCGTYDYVGAGTSVARLYVDGVEVASSTTAVEYTATTIPITIGSQDGVGAPFIGVTSTAFYTEKVLSADTISRMASALLPVVQGSRGEMLTVTRASPRSCCTLDGASCSLIAANRPCIRGAALDVSRDSVNLLSRSNEISIWSCNAGTCDFRANEWVEPFGTRTGTLIVDDDSVNNESAFRSFATSTAGTYTVACDFVAGTVGPATTTAQLTIGALGGATGTTTCTISGLTAKSSRHSCSATFEGTVTQVYALVGVGHSASATGSVRVANCQINTGSTATPYCPTAATAPVTCLADKVTVATTADWPVERGTLEVTYRPRLAIPGSAESILDARGGSPLNGWSLSRLTGNLLSFDRRVAGTSSPSSSAVLSWVADRPYRIRVQWTPASVRVWRDDELVIDDSASVTVTAIGDTAHIGRDVGSGSQAQAAITIERISR